MAELIEDSRFITPLWPSLYHLSRVAVALPLLNDFDIPTVRRAIAEIQRGHSTTSDADSEEDQEISYRRAMKKVHLIPPLLRKSVLEAVYGLLWGTGTWQYRHSKLFKFMDRKCFFHWKSAGTIDTIKIAEQLVLDQNISIESRFEIACIYCLEKYVKILWAKMKASGKTKCYKTTDKNMVGFWVRWLGEGCRVPWTQAAGAYLRIPVRRQRIPLTRLSAFCPFLRPEDRKKFLIPILFSESEDFLQCMYRLSKEEQEEILRETGRAVLGFYSDWPLQSLFLETAKKLFSFFDAADFHSVFKHISNMKNFKKDFDYCQLLRDFWNIAPDHLKEGENQLLRMEIVS